jgi:hypothetical protein
MPEPLLYTGEPPGEERAERTADETPADIAAAGNQERRARTRAPDTLADRWEVRQAELRAEAAAHPEDRAGPERLADERADAAREYPFSAGTPIEVQVNAVSTSSFTVRFDPDSTDALREQAAADGVGVVQMLRAWVLERLATDRRLPAATVDEFGPTVPPDVDLDTEEIVLRDQRRLTDEPAERMATDVAGMQTGRVEI